MKIKNRSVILVVRDGEMIRPDTIGKKIAPALSVFQTILTGGKVSKGHIEMARIDLQNLWDSLVYIKKAGKQ